MKTCFSLFLILGVTCLGASAEETALQLRRQRETAPGGGEFQTVVEKAMWDASKTAVIVCDVWDLHHSLNAVRRVEEMAPRLNQFLIEARRRGMTVIHSPSDCMEAYRDHPARQRAVEAKAAEPLPDDIRSWCSRIPAEERAVYPLDQSDGGDDDDPAEHARWAAKLKAMGRNVGTPWLRQSKLIEIDSQRDYISDRGDEVWNVLQQQGIENVILTGVHTNMCVLGRPFGLRQMARNGKHVVLVRDLTDTMYNPARWPYVDHFTGTDLIVSHIERYVCPTITSDQLLGGEPFRFQADRRPQREIAAAALEVSAQKTAPWPLVSVPLAWENAPTRLRDAPGSAWYRCAIRVPEPLAADGLEVLLDADADFDAWLNGVKLPSSPTAGRRVFTAPPKAIDGDDANLLVLRTSAAEGDRGLTTPPVVRFGGRTIELSGRWQLRVGDDESWSNIPLPARYGASPDILFQ